MVACPVPTVYVPLSDVPEVAVVKVTVAPVSRVTVSVEPASTLSLITARTLMVSPSLYEPSAVVDVKDDTDGATVSIVRPMVLLAALPFPAASDRAPAATEIDPASALPEAGVNKAV